LWIAVVVLLARAAVAEPRAQSLGWVAYTRSPAPVGPGGADVGLYRLCGAPDAGLVAVAARIATRQAEGRPRYDASELRELGRAQGVPQVWPRAWLLGGAHPPDEEQRRLGRWLGAEPRAGVARCGLARGADGSGQPLLAAVTVDVLADLAALPRRVRASEWLSLDAEMLLPATSAQVVLLGPRGRPRRVLCSLGAGRIRSRFMLDAPGRWLVQVVAELGAGPRPILEAVVFVDSEPPAGLAPPAAAVPPVAGQPADEQLLGLLTEARRQEGLGPLRRDVDLAALALAHARAMRQNRLVAHDVGEGSPRERVDEAELGARLVGENVASAADAARAHQALWESPSHRENMLQASFGRVGVGAVADERGKLWVVELFAD
jgi:uncharacterized protein YkwD